MISLDQIFGFFAIFWPLVFAYSGSPGRDLEVLTRDVLIIGGGSAGTYSAIRLQQLGKSVAVVEKEPILGGHTNTFIDPVTSTPIDYGVQFWEDIPVVQNYLASLGVPLTPVFSNATSPFVSLLADLNGSGAIVPASTMPASDPASAFATYSAQLASFPVDDGFLGLPSPVPDDLLLTFGDFVHKYKLDDLAFLVYRYAQGLGNILGQTTIYVMKNFGPAVVGGVFDHFVVTAHHDNHELYDKAQAQLGSDALVSSTVIWVDRKHSTDIKALVSTPSGQVFVTAKKLLIAIPPTLDNLKFLDLDENSRYTFSQFNNSFYWNGIVRNSGVPDNTTITNTSPTAPEGIPPLPGLYTIEATGVPGLHSVYYGSPYAIADDQVKSAILDGIAKVVKAGGFSQGATAPEFVAFGDHRPFTLTVSPDAIKDGFYTRLNALQGQDSTWWTGAAWQTQDSSLIWNFTEYNVLPQLAA
jgi:hypothetical protein